MVSFVRNFELVEQLWMYFLRSERRRSGNLIQMYYIWNDMFYAIFASSAFFANVGSAYRWCNMFLRRREVETCYIRSPDRIFWKIFEISEISLWPCSRTFVLFLEIVTTAMYNAPQTSLTYVPRTSHAEKLGIILIFGSQWVQRFVD